MEPNLFSGTEEPATLSDIAAIEQQYGFTLPDDYKAHLLQYNGGWPERSIFMEVRPDGEQIARDISDFYSVRYGDITLESGLESLADQLHSDLVPFGDETGGDIFVLSVGPQDYGSVYYIGHEFYKAPEYEYDEETDESTPPAPLDYGAGVHFLAPSFTAFLEGLREPNEAS
ncbi:SMI1/KNR4 family protein [Hymenobacter terrenus]|uniref:SMI1/KNR4 family protein n=1 Tax=Hymenobacter terrenus TaxID=1629124 RepID=UPI000619904F|nr:SMI1/KNR4 family protein [Hymenobacter terrenus]